MFRYQFYGCIIESEFEIKLLIPAESEAGSDDVIRICERDVEADVRRILEEHNEKYYVVDLQTSAFWNHAGYYLMRGGKEIAVKCSEDFNTDTISPWILGYCISIVLLQKGIMAIHCSALKSDGGAVLVSGDSGAGKSTLAGKLLENGCKLMADDVAAVRLEGEECMVYSGFPYQKLCANEIERKQLIKEELTYIDEDKDKYLVPAHDLFEADPQPLRQFFYIVKAPVDHLQIQKMSGFACFMSIKSNLFLANLTGEWENSPEVIGQCMKIASKCDIYTVIRPEDKDTLAEMTERVMNIVISGEM